MGEFLLQHPWVQFFLIYVAVSLVACTWISYRESAAIQSDHEARPKEGTGQALPTTTLRSLDVLEHEAERTDVGGRRGQGRHCRAEVGAHAATEGRPSL